MHQIVPLLLHVLLLRLHRLQLLQRHFEVLGDVLVLSLRILQDILHTLLKTLGDVDECLALLRLVLLSRLLQTFEAEDLLGEVFLDDAFFFLALPRLRLQILEALVLYEVVDFVDLLEDGVGLLPVLLDPQQPIHVGCQRVLLPPHQIVALGVDPAEGLEHVVGADRRDAPIFFPA